MTRTVPGPAASLPPVTLTPEEAAAVAVALAAQPDGPYAAAGRIALDKVLAALEPDPRRREALRASTRLVRSEAGPSGDVRSVLEQGLARRRVLVLRYRDGKGTPSRREVEPQLLARTAEHEYLVAWCRERQAPRWFRWDRVESAELTGQPAPRRDPATLGAPPSETHPAGRALGGPARPERPASPDRPAAPERPARSGKPRLAVLPGGLSS